MAVSFIRTIILYICVLFALKMMGKKQVSELQTSELVIMLLVSDIAAIPMQNTSQTLVSSLVPIAVLVCFEIFISIVMLKNSRIKRLICGNPVVIINNGKLLQGELKRLRMTIDDLYIQLRQMNVFNIKDVEFAIIEPNGKLSVLKKAEKEPLDASTMKISVPESCFDALVVSDGEISDFSLSLCDLSRDWLTGVLQGKNLDLSDIFIMTANKNKEFNIIKKEAK